MSVHDLPVSGEVASPTPTPRTWTGDDWTLVVLPDTQSYNVAQFTALTQWIADNAAVRNIQLALHVGDVVDDGRQAALWNVAREAMAVLDASGVPYLMTTGNHDHDTGEAHSGGRELTAYNADYGPDRFMAHDWWEGGFYEAGRGENAYLLRTISGRDYLILALEWAPRQAVLDWALGVVQTHPTRDVILVTHCLVNYDDTLVRMGHDYDPHSYTEAEVNNGEELWEKFIRHCPNLILGFSGHILGTGVGRLSRLNLAGRQCHMMLANYQYPMIAAAVSGYLRIVTIRPTAGVIEVTTYSPLLDKWLTANAHQFTLDYPG